MSYRAKRVSADHGLVQPFDWGTRGGTSPKPASPQTSSEVAPRPAGQLANATVERDAFLEGYAKGEQAGAEAAAKRGEAMLRRLKETLEEITVLRASMIHRTERQMVQLCLAIARRIVAREVSLDRGLLVGMVRVALDRLGEQANATVRLHPDDHAAVTAGLADTDENAQVQIVADPRVNRGGCLVQSDFGFMDVSPEAQFEELARALLEDGTLVTPAAGTQSHNAAIAE